MINIQMIKVCLFKNGTVKAKHEDASDFALLSPSASFTLLMCTHAWVHGVHHGHGLSVFEFSIN